MIFNRKIGNDFSNQKITGISIVNETENHKEIDITYDNSENPIKLIIDKSYIEYDEERINIENNMKIDINNFELTSKTVEENLNLIKLKVPIKYAREKKDYGIELYNLTNSNVSI